MVKKNGMANVDEHKLKTASINTLRDYIECLPREAFLNWNNEDFDSFKCPSEIPEYIMLGDGCFDLSDFSPGFYYHDWLDLWLDSAHQGTDCGALMPGR